MSLVLGCCCLQCVVTQSTLRVKQAGVCMLTGHRVPQVVLIDGVGTIQGEVVFFLFVWS